MIFNRLKTLNTIIEKCSCTRGLDQININEAFNDFYSFLKSSKMTYVIGNGGSAGIASHFCIDLLKALKLPAAVLTDASVMTCMANDFGYDKVFSEQLNILIKESDLLVAISSSGNSANIINAVKVARSKGGKVITMSGFSQDNHLRQLGDINFWLPANDYGLVEMGHFFLLHTIVDLWHKKPLERLAEHASKIKNI
jgi:D-sedoheptulose 7-phosphate isomerase